MDQLLFHQPSVNGQFRHLMPLVDLIRAGALESRAGRSAMSASVSMDAGESLHAGTDPLLHKSAGIT